MCLQYPYRLQSENKEPLYHTNSDWSIVNLVEKTGNRSIITQNKKYYAHNKQAVSATKVLQDLHKLEDDVLRVWPY